jgi:hypothetical protein
MNRNAKIWCSNFLYDSGVVKSIDFSGLEIKQKSLWHERYQAGERLDPSEFPDKLKAEQSYPDLPKIFKIVGRVIVLRESVKTLLEQFELGASQFHSVRIQDPWGFEEYPGPFFILNIAELCSLFAPEHSARVHRRFPHVPWSVKLATSEPLEIAVRNEPPQGLDLWLDPSLGHVIFLSGALAMAIRKEKIANFKLFPCKEID